MSDFYSKLTLLDSCHVVISFCKRKNRIENNRKECHTDTETG